MNKTCARCDKTVYPTEELKCLDKVWHKGCFKCQECGMTLNMRTYKGYGKLPYCEAHVPKAKHTTMAETPELRRIAENTKIQSNVKYHADFEKSKGKFTQVADDPETLRIKANTKIISNVAYHGDLEKKAHMERQRTLNENGDIVELPTPDNYQQQIDNYANEMLSPTQTRPREYQERPKEYQERPKEYQERPKEYQERPKEYQERPKEYQERPKEYQERPKEYYQYHQPKYEEYNQQYLYNQQMSSRIGRIQDYDPLSDGPRTVPDTQRSSSTLIYNSTNDGKQRGAHHSTQQQHQRVIGRVTDLDPLANEPAHQPVPLPSTNTHINGVVYIAMYDYEANDTDEVSFREGDYISNVSSIDEGWMTGQVLRTGRTGMLPANYVQLVRN